mgnify:CR=1 FL=1
MKIFKIFAIILSTFSYITSKNLLYSINRSINNNNLLFNLEPKIIVDNISDFHTDLQYKYITDPLPENIYRYASGDSDLSRPKGNTLDFSEDVRDSFSYVIQYSSSLNFYENETTIIKDLDKKKYVIKNLKLNETIYYRGAVNEEELNNSTIHKLTVNSIPPRNLDIPNVDNARDIGGYKTYLVKDGIIKQGLYYRTAALADLEDEGKYIISKVLGIKREINLIETNFDPNIEGVTNNFIPMKDTDDNNRFEEFDHAYKQVFNLIAEADKYPIILHCLAGADRTGVMSFALLALLGVEFNDIKRDYAFTSFGVQGTRYIENSQILLWMDKLERYEGDTLAERTKSWLMSKGIKEITLEHIREIFIEGYKRNE